MKDKHVESWIIELYVQAVQAVQDVQILHSDSISSTGSTCRVQVVLTVQDDSTSSTCNTHRQYK